ncbi:hypothetical protein [Moheibacter sp.]|uniref:hypothetical protein n=1 Tax=Moheibacter sp. TaxID=1965316 RepID=UPI003C78D535
MKNNSFYLFRLALGLIPFLFLNAQENNNPEELKYPDLIPVLQDGLYGYCDKDLNIMIEVQFERASLFSQDFDFMDIKDPAKKMYESSDYATVYQEGEKLRIDKNGKVVYKYNDDDFNEIRPKEIVGYLPKEQPFEKFLDEKSQLWGVRNPITGENILPAKYSIIWKEYYVRFQTPQYPLVLVETYEDKGSFFVGLNGTEYIIRK